MPSGPSSTNSRKARPASCRASESCSARAASARLQLAVEYVHRFNLYYPGGVFWIDAEQGLSRLIAVMSVAAGIEIDGRLPESDQLEALWHELARHPATLLVFDNFPEQASLRAWLPITGDIHVLVTTPAAT